MVVIDRFHCIISNPILQNDCLGTRQEHAAKSMSHSITSKKSTLARVTASCLTAPSHYLNQCWLIIISPFNSDASVASHHQHVRLMASQITGLSTVWTAFWGEQQRKQKNLPFVREIIWQANYTKNASHYNDVIMGATASQIARLTVVYLTVYLDADQRKHQSFASLASVRGIHRGPVNSRTNGP